MDNLLSVIRQAGERNLIMVEAYLVHIEKAGYERVLLGSTRFYGVLQGSF